MDRGVAVIVMAAVGGLIALQPAINAGLGRETGNVAASSSGWLGIRTSRDRISPRARRFLRRVGVDRP